MPTRLHGWCRPQALHGCEAWQSQASKAGNLPVVSIGHVLVDWVAPACVVKFSFSHAAAWQGVCISLTKFLMPQPSVRAQAATSAEPQAPTSGPHVKSSMKSSTSGALLCSAAAEALHLPCSAASQAHTEQ